MKQAVTRRGFVRSLAGGAAATSLSAPQFMQTGAPNGKLQHACIGVSGMGWHDFNQIASSPNVEIVALCDVDLTRIGRAAERFPNARRYQDWRELFDKEQKTIDSVNVSIPDHMHAPVTVTALRLGKHVYCQKPLTHEVYEARQVAREAKKTGVVTQMGTQHVSQLADRLGVRMIQDLAVGKIKRVYLWSNKPIGTLRPPGPRPVKTDPVPDGLDWDKWLGTAPVRPYVAGVYHPGLWRGWQDFGVGWLGDMGCHIFDSVYRSLKLTAPKSVRARVEPEWADNPARRSETWPVWQIVDYVFPGTGLTAGNTIEATWSDGYKYPPEDVRQHIDNQPYPEQGVLYVGENGSLLLPHQGLPQLFPREKFKAYPPPKVEPGHHYHDWASACLAGGPTLSSFDHAGPLAEVVLLGTVALRCPGEELLWDATNMKVTNLPEANQYVRRSYRKGCETSGPG